MDIKEAIVKRRSKRWFSDKTISKEVLEEIISEAQMTPSWANSQPWKVWIATGETLAKIRQDHWAFALQRKIGNADFSTQHREDWDSFTRVNMRQWSEAFITFEGKRGADFATFQARLYNAPALVYLTIPKKSSPWSIFDVGAFSQTLMLSAFGKGIDVCLPMS